MEIKKNLLFFVDKEGTKETGYKPDGKLRLRIRFSSGKIDFNVGYRVELSKWNTETQRCKKGTTHGKKKTAATEINNEIQRLESLANDVFKSFEVSDHIPTVLEYRTAFNAANDKFNGIKDKQNEFSFFEKLQEFMLENKNRWAHATYQKFEAVENHLKDFNSALTFEMINESVFANYVGYLRDVKEMRNSTIIKQIRFLKWFLRWALKKGYTTDNAFGLFKPGLKTTQKTVVFLTWDELTKLREYSIPQTKLYLERVRDVFLFQCYTSLRYSDVYNLRRSDIKDDHIEVITVKTADSLTIDLNNYSRAILDKYKDVHFPEDKALPVISNQKMNDYLKELGELAEIDEPVRETYYKGNERIDEVMPKYALLSTHDGRRTFICNSLAMGIPAQTVLKWTGHSDYKAMKPYIDVADKDRQEAMKLWDKKEDNNNELLEKLKNLPKDKLAELLKTLEL